MAATIAKAFGYDANRIKETHRLGSKHSLAEANTWRTFTQAFVNADGSGGVRVIRDGEVMHSFDFGPEGDRS